LPSPDTASHRAFKILVAEQLLHGLQVDATRLQFILRLQFLPRSPKCCANPPAVKLGCGSRLEFGGIGGNIGTEGSVTTQGTRKENKYRN
jgi:hypothetical protein